MLHSKVQYQHPILRVVQFWFFEATKISKTPWFWGPNKWELEIPPIASAYNLGTKPPIRCSPGTCPFRGVAWHHFSVRLFSLFSFHVFRLWTGISQDIGQVYFLPRNSNLYNHARFYKNQTKRLPSAAIRSCFLPPKSRKVLIVLY